MIDLTTNYLGLTLKNPLVCSSSTLCQDLDNLRRMEDAGAAAVVLHSLFEEQIELESQDLDRCLLLGAESYAEATSYFPDMQHYNTGPEGYLEFVGRAKKSLGIPLMGSLNGTTRGGWVRYAKGIEQAGADALELNVYDIVTDPDVSAADVEDRIIDLVQAVRAEVKIPLAVKLSPFYSSLVNLGRRLGAAGAGGLVLFNRFYQPDFDLEQLDVAPHLRLSGPEELPLRLHWVAILYGRVAPDLAITGGIHSARDVIKAMMAGARVAQTASALYKHGIEHVETVLRDLRRWLELHEYESVRQMQGSLSLKSVADPAAYQRANYMKLLRAQALRGAR